MRFQLIFFGLLPLATVLVWPKTADASCVVADVSIQAAIDGSEVPAEQTNDVDVDQEGTCSGNTSIHTNRQIQVGGTGTVRQTRRSRHVLRNTHNSEPSGRPVGPTVVVPVEVQADVDNPADRLQRQTSSRRRNF